MKPEISADILLVDDRPANLLAIEVVLEPLGARLSKARSGEEALSLVEDRHFLAIILDVRMPGIDGFETAERIRRHERFRETPIIFMTAGDLTEQDVNLAYSYGFTDLMPKPFAPDAIREKVRSFLESERRKEADRKQMETVIRDAEERLRLALRAANMVAWDWDPMEDSVVCSEGCREVFGLQTSVAAEYVKLIHPEDLPHVRQAFHSAADTEGEYEIEYRILRPDGQVRWVESKGRVLQVAGSRKRMFGVSLDVTNRKAAEAELHRLNAELAVARDAALAGSQAKSTFLASMSHVLRTPLNAIIGYAEMLIEGPADHPGQLDPAAMAQDLEMIRCSGQHLLSLLDNMLDLANLDFGRIALRGERFDPRQVVVDVSKSFEDLARSKGIQIGIQCDDQLPSVVHDLQRFRQILHNLISNAVKFTELGRVDVTCRTETSSAAPGAAPKRWLIVEVSDTGPGISKPQVESLFERFQTAEPVPTRKQSGSGIGLALTKSLVQIMGGSIEAKSRPGLGSTFRVKLPVLISRETAGSQAADG